MEVTEFVKKSLAFGLGAASLSAEKLRQFADEMVTRGEMSSEDAGRFMDEVSERAQEEKRSIQDWINDQVAKMVRQMGAADAERVDRLETRVNALERRLAELSADMVTSSHHKTGESEETD